MKFFDGGGGVLMAFPQSTLGELPPELDALVVQLEERLGKKRVYTMVNIIPAGVTVPLHTDTLKQKVQRWHYPLVTNLLATFNGIHLPLHQWYGPVAYWEPHWVANLGAEDRVHLVVDLNT